MGLCARSPACGRSGRGRASAWFGVTPTVEVIHAGLECGILCGKRPGMDMISVGPDMRDIHTPREMLSVDSTRRTYELVCATLAALTDTAKQ